MFGTTVYIYFLIVRLTFVLFQMSQLRAAKRVCKNPGTKAYYLTKSCNDVARRDWLYRDGAARKVLGDRDFVFGDDQHQHLYLHLLQLEETVEPSPFVFQSPDG